MRYNKRTNKRRYRGGGGPAYGLPSEENAKAQAAAAAAAAAAAPHPAQEEVPVKNIEYLTNILRCRPTTDFKTLALVAGVSEDDLEGRGLPNLTRATFKSGCTSGGRSRRRNKKSRRGRSQKKR